jgi:1-acyl-sn-glycerol-3-phosphate acyltransferase
MSFIEGTRFTPEKHDKQQSPFQHLLRPKAGGIGFVFGAMGEHIAKILDVTIHYPQGIPTFIDFLSGKVTCVNVDVKVLPVTDELIGDYFNDRQYKQQFQKWVNQLWLNKDKQLINIITKEGK